MEPQIRYARTSDGANIAYTVLGDGVPLLFASNVMGDVHWYSHNESTRQQVDELVAAGCMVVRYDMRGMGSSDRDACDFSVEARTRDLEAVADQAGLARFALCGFAHGNAAAVTYAADHADRVSRLVLVNPYLTGAAYYEKVPGAGVMMEMRAIAERDWDLFTLTLASTMAGHMDPAAAMRTAELFRGAVTSTMYVAFAEAARKTVLTDALERLTVDTLVLVDSSPSSHPDLGRAVAARIRGARFAITDEYGRDLLLFLGLRPYERPAPAPAAAPSSTAVILFADIVESTAMTERIGNAAFRERSTALETRIRAAVQSHGGSTVAGRTLGDGVLGTFTSASEGIAAALECAAAGGDLGLALHLGLHAGDVLREDGNVHGIAVSLASRVSALAEPNEILVSQTVRDLARASAGVAFEDRGERELKGIADPVRVYAVVAS